MAKKKKITSEQLVDAYMAYVLTHNEPPKSVYAFAAEQNIEEAQFYQFFSSFNSLEQAIFKLFLHNTLNVLHKSADYETYDAQNKLLSFYYTFFEMLTANRSYVVYALQHKGNALDGLKTLHTLKADFKKHIQSLGIDTLDLKQKKLNNLQDKGLEETAWGQLLFTMKFWLDDTSPAFEKTDMLIEKSVKASFDLLTNLPLKNIVDLGKFIFKEKFSK